jgi:WS/DGAT/MGAT family acyltransferase
MKVHHSLTDGIGGMKLVLHLFDTAPESPPLTDDVPAPTAAPLSAAGLVRESLLHDWGRISALVRHEMAAAAPTMVRAARHPIETATTAAATAQSVARMVAPVSETMSPVMKGRGLGRHLAMFNVPLADLKRASAAADGTLNDGFLTAVTGGLRRYHAAHGEASDELRVTLPISIRTEDDPITGNRITLQRFTVPVGVEDPAVRMKEIDARCRFARDEPALPHTNAVAGALNLLPPSVVGGMLKHVDFLASNVPGIPFPVYLAGAEVTGYYPFGPTIGAALNVTLLSYNGSCCIGVTIDTAAVPDTDVLMRCLKEGFDEVLALA